MARNSVSPPRRPERSGDRYRDAPGSSRDYQSRDRYSQRPEREDRDRRDRGYDERRRGGYDRNRPDNRGRTRRDRDDDYSDRQKADRDRDRERDRERGRNRDERAGPSGRSASPRPRQSRDGSQSSSKREGTPEDKAKPNFAPSGLLADATKTVKHHDGTSTVLKYHEPPEARKPVQGWRLYVFKGKEQVDLLHIHRQSAYLIGRDRTIADLTIDHPSCSKQHAVIQFRLVKEKNELGDVKNVIKPFIIDLESTNGTHVNDDVIPTSRYYELKPGDVIKFGESQREYVLLHDEAT
ncbi:SMAD/FHA domain-containing protein [Laetiporus sulphureus 93-53]|uniref:SMAD/FHA domain-containing protein n=1 Tax=Laetiporus sulphureus 93-53 TaxID=1314785 RepID=A0A165HQH7_9APHY|nr:SMAD/FHA domain-containing protein [Laetiporus sulphureus 93-53]KZT12052.1 SMAD/FHA domain-containing protein [Laetiporus sulphureus 93-53]